MTFPSLATTATPQVHQTAYPKSWNPLNQTKCHHPGPKRQFAKICYSAICCWHWYIFWSVWTYLQMVYDSVQNVRAICRCQMTAADSITCTWYRLQQVCMWLVLTVQGATFYCYLLPGRKQLCHMCFSRCLSLYPLGLCTVLGVTIPGTFTTVIVV